MVAKVLISPNWWHLVVWFLVSFISLISPFISLTLHVLHHVIIEKECIVLLPCTLLAHGRCKDTYISLNKDANERLIYSIRLILSQCPFLYDIAYMFLSLLSMICKTSVSTKKKEDFKQDISTDEMCINIFHIFHREKWGG